jgi:hypothetical protein
MSLFDFQTNNVESTYYKEIIHTLWQTWTVWETS